MKAVTKHFDHEEERLYSFYVVQKGGTGREGGDYKKVHFSSKLGSAL